MINPPADPRMKGSLAQFIIYVTRFEPLAADVDTILHNNRAQLKPCRVVNGSSEWRKGWLASQVAVTSYPFISPTHALRYAHNEPTNFFHFPSLRVTPVDSSDRESNCSDTLVWRVLRGGMFSVVLFMSVFLRIDD
ncbi:hypothetical protein K0M31_007461 [Melipona bicolor]|uniref:Uncharacterized protein n=1 Tax=Melipona bicolor TaxID=60889 RepID=A0AA40GBR7_9HYME|nr:hypothetical protein K0M31_007461 [Melipona bicolor]